MIVDEADEDLEMADDPFMEAGIPELPGYKNHVNRVNSNPVKTAGDENISNAISKASEVSLEIGQNSHNGQKWKYKHQIHKSVH